MIPVFFSIFPSHSPASVHRNTNLVHLPPQPQAGQNGLSRSQKNAAKIGGFRKSGRQTTTSFHEADRLLFDTEVSTLVLY